MKSVAVAGPKTPGEDQQQGDDKGIAAVGIRMLETSTTRSEG